MDGGGGTSVTPKQEMQTEMSANWELDRWRCNSCPNVDGTCWWLSVCSFNVGVLVFSSVEMKWFKKSKWCPQYKWGLSLWWSFLLCGGFFWLPFFFFFYLAVLGLRHVMPDPSFGRADPLIVIHKLSCPAACWILVPWPGIEPVSLALQGRFLTTRPPGRSASFLWSPCCVPDVLLPALPLLPPRPFSSSPEVSPPSCPPARKPFPAHPMSIHDSVHFWPSMCLGHVSSNVFFVFHLLAPQPHHGCLKILIGGQIGSQVRSAWILRQKAQWQNL